MRVRTWRVLGHHDSIDGIGRHRGARVLLGVTAHPLGMQFMPEALFGAAEF